MYVFTLFLLLSLLLLCSVFFSLFPAPCTWTFLKISESLLRRLWSFYHSPSANTRGTSRMFGKLPKSPNLVCPSLSQASFRRRRRPRRGRKDKRLHNVAFRNSFLFFPHTHFLWGEKGHRQGTYRESSLRGLLIIKFYQLYLFCWTCF